VDAPRGTGPQADWRGYAGARIAHASATEGMMRAVRTKADADLKSRR
jgi:hypothetical protein